MITTFSSLVKKDVLHIIKHHWKQFLGVGVLIGFLLFLLNIFLGASAYTYSFGETLKDKLGIYFYIKDTPGEESITYQKVMDLQTNLQKQGLGVMFSSKDDAMKFLENKMPEIASSFNKFGIQNPLPSTLYVMFKNRDQYEGLKTTLLNYKDIILNIKDLDNGTSIRQQENRVLNIINLTNFITTISLIIVVFLSLVIFAFLGFLTSFLFQYFKKHVEIKNLLGGATYETAKEFSIINLLTLAFGFVLCLALLIVSWSILGVSLYNIFGVGFLDIFAHSSLWVVVGGFFGEIIMFALFSLIFSYFYTVSVSNKLR